MKRTRQRNEVAGEPAIVDGTTYRPVAGYASRTYGFRSFGLFKSSGRPLRLEIEGPSGELTIVPIRDLQSMMMGVVLVVTVAMSLLILLGRRGS